MEFLYGLINAINNFANAIIQLIGSDWTGTVSAFCSVISLIAIIILLIERREKKRPYLQISFELVRSSLVCLVIRNVGDVPAMLNEIKFNPDFVKQMPENARNHAKDRTELNIYIHPKQQWVLGLDQITPTVLQYQNTQLEVSFAYTAKGKKRKKYKDTEIIDFNDYSGFLVYISEVDELRDEVKKLTQAMKTVAKHLNKLANRQPAQVKTETYRNIGDEYSKTIVTGFQENTILQKDAEDHDVRSNGRKEHES